jgi:hypothetical protein
VRSERAGRGPCGADHGHERHKTGARADQEHGFARFTRPQEMATERASEFDFVPRLSDIVEEG